MFFFVLLMILLFSSFFDVVLCFSFTYAPLRSWQMGPFHRSVALAILSGPMMRMFKIILIIGPLKMASATEW